MSEYELLLMHENEKLNAEAEEKGMRRWTDCACTSRRFLT
jgi:hypothetical protein